jgi:predicted transcriptional regulator of viral defense system
VTKTLLEKILHLQVFTLDEALELARKGQTRRQLGLLLSQYMRTGAIGRVRSGLYYTIPRGQDPKTFVPDRILIASKLDPKAVLAYHTALELLGGGYSVWNEIYVLAGRRHWHHRERFTFQSISYRMVFPPTRLGGQAFTRGIETLERFGQTIRVTGRARTLVDCLDRLEYAGGLDELLGSVVTWPSIDQKDLLAYLHLLKRRVLYARVGFLLERFKNKWAVPDSVIHTLQNQLPKRTTYFDATPGSARFVRRWHLMVPARLASQEAI